MKYTAKKSNFEKKGVKFIYVFFENGDYVSLDGSELKAISVDVYDKLVRHNNGFCAVAASGYIEFKISNHAKPAYGTKFLHNLHDYKQNRKQYIEQRCLNESRITEIRFFDKLNWSRELLGDFRVETDGIILKLTVIPQQQMGDAWGDIHQILLGEIKKEDVFGIDLDFENCESFMVYNPEIKEIKLELAKKLDAGSGRFHRCIKGGYIKLKLKKYFRTRRNSLFDNINLKRKDFEQRLCGKKGSSTHDICHFYIDFYHAGFGDSLCECIDLDDMKSKKEINRLIKKEEADESFYYAFESGCAKLLKDRTIVLTFGRNAKQLIKELCKNNA